MDVAKCSLMEIMMAYVGKDHLENFSDQKKWTILGLMNKPGSYLETDIGFKFKSCSDDVLKTILLEKIQNLQKQLSKIYTVENHVQTEAEKSVPELEDVPSTDEDPKNILDEALSVHDSSDEDEDGENDEKPTDATFVVESLQESEESKESKKAEKMKENLDNTFTSTSHSPLLPTSNRLRKSRLFDVADWKEDQNDVVESPVLSRLKQNRKRRQLQNGDENKISPKPSNACKRLRLEKLSAAEDAASADDDVDKSDEVKAAERLPVKVENSPQPSRQRSQQSDDTDATHFSELVSDGQNNTDRPEEQSVQKKTTDVSSSKWTRCEQCSKRVLKEDKNSHIEKMHKKKKVAEKVSPEKVLERVSTGEEDTENASEEPEEEPSQKPEDTDDRADEPGEENSEETDEDPESSPTKVILKESDLIRYTKSFEIYITPLTKEEISKFSGGKRVIHISSSDSEFDEMAEKSKSLRQKSPRKKVIKPKDCSSDSDSDAENVEPIRIHKSNPKPNEKKGRPRGSKNRNDSMLKNLQIDMNDSPTRRKRIGPKSQVRGSL